MAKHYLLSPRSKDISIFDVANISDDEAFELFKKIRWSENDGKPICPICGNTEKIYLIEGGKRFRCGYGQCRHTFSITSMTIFNSRKMKLQVYLTALFLFAIEAKSLSAIKLSAQIRTTYQTAWVLLQKIRSTLEEYNWAEKFKGVCQIDGVYVNHYVRPANKICNRVDRRKVYKPNKRVILSIRQIYSAQEDGIGAQKTKVFILKSENAEEIKNIVYKHIELGSEIHADENVAYDDLGFLYNLKRVNHKIEYLGNNGENNNQCESFNARLRRAFKGSFHKASTLYLSRYANEIAYREDTRRMSSRWKYLDLLTKCLKSPPSSEMTAYWQGNKRIAERLGA